MRTSRKQVEELFNIWCAEHGFRKAEHANDAGGYQLDYYNGYHIEKVVTEQGGVTTPFGSERFSPKDMANLLHFSLRVSDHQKAK